MGYDVYTPAWDRLQQDARYRELRAEYDAWSQRPTVQSQDETEQDRADYNRISDEMYRLEAHAGHGSFGIDFRPSLEAIRQWWRSSEWMPLHLTHHQVGQLLEEYRLFLRGAYWAAKQGRLEHNFRIRPDQFVANPYQAAVLHYKLFCQVWRLGEGCRVV